MSKKNPFSNEIHFEYGMALPLSPFVRRLVADNAGPLTFKGTNVYILGRGEVAIIDPGPDDEAHVQTLMGVLAGDVLTHILLTHTHRDHSGAIERLVELTGAKTYGFGPTGKPRGAYKINQGGKRFDSFAQTDFVPDVALADGDRIEGLSWSLTALHMPGHAPDHLCYAMPQEKALFTGDHVMPWSTSVIAPPEGNMSDYMRSLEFLLHRDDELYLPGHGGRVHKPKHLVRAYQLHRQWRESSIVEALADGHLQVKTIMPQLYRELEPDMHGAANLSVLAHLLHLVDKGRARQIKGQGIDSHFALVEAEDKS